MAKRKSKLNRQALAQERRENLESYKKLVHMHKETQRLRRLGIVQFTREVWTWRKD